MKRIVLKIQCLRRSSSIDNRLKFVHHHHRYYSNMKNLIRSSSSSSKHSFMLILLSLILLLMIENLSATTIHHQHQQKHHHSNNNDNDWWLINQTKTFEIKKHSNVDNNLDRNSHRNISSYHYLDENRNRMPILLLLIRPLLRIRKSENLSSIELVINLKNQSFSSIKTLPNLLMTAFENYSLSINLTAQKYRQSNDRHQQFWSPIYAVQQTNENEQDFFETIEQQWQINQSSLFYTDNLLELFHQQTDRKQQKLCQLFTSNDNGDHRKHYHQTTIQICTDGSMNGIITLMDDGGHILLETEQQHCFDHLQFLTDDDNWTLLSCEHRLKFIGNFFNQSPLRGQKHRLKRSYSSERTIEMSIVTDLSMYLYHGNSLRNYVFTLIAMVSHLFKHSSIGNEINIKLIKLTSLMDEQPENNWYGSAHKTLRHFCRWQYEHNHHDDKHQLHYDTAILLTKIDLCSKNDYNPNPNHHHHHHHNDNDYRRTTTTSTSSTRSSSCDTLGLAHSGQICDPETSCAIVEDNGLSAAFTIAHELGHLLGVPHDDEEQCKRFYEQQQTINDNYHYNNHLNKNDKQTEFNVMVRMIDSNSHMWSWSSCSKHFITEFLDSGHGDCLLDNNSMDIRQSSSSIDSNIHHHHHHDTFRRRSFFDSKYSKLPAGTLYNADEQCRLVFDRNSSICLDMPYCKKLWCTSNTVGGCRTQHMPWADGTECGNGYWCQQGQCVRIDTTRLQPINGGWSEWSSWSECSLSCGGGIRKSRRDCTNPNPQYGGKFCLGERIRYESCNLEPCPYQSRYEDSRAKQCAEYNRYNLTWTPKYDGIQSTDVCSLYCQSNSGESLKLKPKVIDGTPCTPESFDICVNGKCLMAGCDRILGSSRHIDYCGVCGGNNSTCREINGQFKPRTVQHGYTFVLSIPPGAANVEIIKEPSSDNWLALRGEYGNYLLNGHFTVNVYERKWYYGDTTVEYSGTKTYGYERINITRSIQNPLHLEILCVGELHLPTINYNFAVTSDNQYINYQWKIDPYWSTCNKVCNGEQERRPYCWAQMRSSWLMDTTSRSPQISEIKVSDNYCDQQQRPATEYRVCNGHCELEWHIHYRSHCSSKCGQGFRTLKINCTQIFHNHNERIYIDDFYCYHLGAKPSETENCTGNSDNSNDCHISYQWQYSDWSQCQIFNQQQKHQHTCGQGQQNRIVNCISTITTYPDSGNNNPMNIQHSNVDHELCRQYLSTEPILLQSCQIECPRWKIDQWSQCKGSCTTNTGNNNGEKYRKITCWHADQQISDAYCEQIETKPIERIKCELTECQQNFYHHQQQQHLDNRSRSIIEAAQSMIENNEIYSYDHHDIDQSSLTSFIWQSGEWSSCDILSQYVREYHNRFTENFYQPKCFESIDQANQLRESFLPLFHLNNSLYSNSYQDLANLLGLDIKKLKRRRYVACINQQNQQLTTEDKCDQKLKPNSEENCPIEQNLLKLMPEFNLNLCPPSTTTTKDLLILNEIDSSRSNNIQQQHDNNDHRTFIEHMEWRTSEWSECFCDLNRRKFLRKRSIHCIRLADGNNIPDEYCYHNQQLSGDKPNEIEECQMTMTMTNANECDPYARQMLHEQTEIDQFNYRYSLSPTSSTTSKPSIMIITPTTTAKTALISAEHQMSPLVSDLSTINHQQQQQISLPLNNDDNGGWTEWYDWSECSVKCGNGIQTREPKCSLLNNKMNSKQPKQNSLCDERKRPQQQYRQCHRICDIFQWHYSDWSECHAECGQNGFRIRTAECRDWTGTRVSNHFCENIDHQSNNHQLKEQCYRLDCNNNNNKNKLVWRTGQWSEVLETDDDDDYNNDYNNDTISAQNHADMVNNYEQLIVIVSISLVLLIQDH
ncbi:A disintegrin and metalloproteinase with thrombospondin motifs 20-like isoform X2 [Dermatophagoides pteronyssinus]|uniref:A disintegrin and metalloproteinase with thrombospondin motifs 20-like isoform X2 n=1 Tax=Dermatophagoides pteronyssinus TaxID=6956 RepID=UPI003F66B3F4